MQCTAHTHTFGPSECENALKKALEIIQSKMGLKDNRWWWMAAVPTMNRSWLQSTHIWSDCPNDSPIDSPCVSATWYTHWFSNCQLAIISTHSGTTQRVMRSRFSSSCRQRSSFQKEKVVLAGWDGDLPHHLINDEYSIMPEAVQHCGEEASHKCDHSTDQTHFCIEHDVQNWTESTLRGQQWTVRSIRVTYGNTAELGVVG